MNVHLITCYEWRKNTKTPLCETDMLQSVNSVEKLSIEEAVIHGKLLR